MRHTNLRPNLRADLGRYGNVHGWGAPLPDRQAHGGVDYVPWLLSQLHQQHLATGACLLDVFTLYFYVSM